MSNIDTLIRCAMLQVMMLKVVVRTNMRMVPPVRTMSDVYMMFDCSPIGHMCIYMYVLAFSVIGFKFVGSA